MRIHESFKACEKSNTKVVALEAKLAEAKARLVEAMDSHREVIRAALDGPDEDEKLVAKSAAWWLDYEKATP